MLIMDISPSCIDHNVNHGYLQQLVIFDIDAYPHVSVQKQSHGSTIHQFTTALQ